MANRVSHGHDAQPERERYADQADPDLRESSGDNGTAATRKGQPKCTDNLRNVFFCIHPDSPAYVGPGHYVARIRRSGGESHGLQNQNGSRLTVQLLTPRSQPYMIRFADPSAKRPRSDVQACRATQPSSAL